MLLCDFAHLDREVGELQAAGVDAFHLDVMDGVFVPNLSYGLPIVEAFRSLTDGLLDVHLMIQRPRAYIRQFCEAGADIITFHVEADDDPLSLIREIQDLGIAAGVTLNPSTSLDLVRPCLGCCDVMLVMSVEAGFGGQRFHPEALSRLRAVGGELNAGGVLEVDGGVNQDTIGECAAAGARWHVVGSGVFRAESYSRALQSLRRTAEQGASTSGEIQPGSESSP